MSAHITDVANVALRKPERHDAQAITEALRDNRVARMLARVPQPYDRKDAEDWLETVDHRPPGDLVFAVTVSDRLAGVVAVEDRAGVMTLGYWLARPYWGRGITTRAVRECLVAHFDAGGVNVASGVFADNPASLRVQEKLGFTVTGRGEIFSLGRNRMVVQIETELTRQAFEAVAGVQASPTSSQTGKWSDPTAA